MKYLVFGSVTSAVMIFGLTFWFGMTGSSLLEKPGSTGRRSLRLPGSSPCSSASVTRPP